MSMVMYGHDVHTLETNKLAAKARADGWTSLNWIAKNGDMWRLFGVPPEKGESSGGTSLSPPAEQVRKMDNRPTERRCSFDIASSSTSAGYVVWAPKTSGGTQKPKDADGPPRIRSELGGLMGPGYRATGYEPPPRRRALLDDPTGDDIAGDVK